VGPRQQREDSSITSDIERRKRDWEEPTFQEVENPEETEKIEEEKRREQAE
jgi:hypothetical protein